MLELTLERHGQQLQQPAELVLEPLGQQQMEINLKLEPRGQQLQQPVGLVFESLGQRVLALDLQLLEQQVAALPGHCTCHWHPGLLQLRPSVHQQVIS
jgi:hypothetical protein